MENDRCVQSASKDFDKSGKNTALRVLKSYFENMGLVVATMAFPDYRSPSGELIREWLDGKSDADVHTFNLWQAADKQHAQAEIQNLEDSGVDVLLIDRYIHSAWAYGSHQSDLDWLKDLTKHCRMPDAVVYMDVEPEVSLHRKGKYGENDRYEGDLDILRHARDVYHTELVARCAVPDLLVQTIDANQPQLLVQACLFRAANRLCYALELSDTRCPEPV